MKNIRRLLAALLVLGLTAALIPGAGAAESGGTQITMATGVAGTPDVQVDAAWDDSWFAGDAAAYRHALALTAMALSGAAYAETEDGSAAGDALAALGFTQVKAFHYETVQETGDDLAAYTFARKTIRAGGRAVPLVAVVVRGTGDVMEWASNLRMGVGGDHEGFALAAGELTSNLQKYLSEAEISPAQARFLITGHSRGGAAANLTAVRLTEAGTPASRIFCYTFAAPAVSTKGQLEGYESFFNIIQEEDLVTRIPLSAWGYRRYGVDLRLPGRAGFGEGYQDRFDAMNRQYRALTGQSYIPLVDPAAVDRALEAMERQIPALSDANRALLEALFGGQGDDLSAYLNRNKLAALKLGQAALTLSGEITGLFRQEGGGIACAHSMAGYYSWLAACETEEDAEAMFQASASSASLPDGSLRFSKFIEQMRKELRANAVSEG